MHAGGLFGFGDERVFEVLGVALHFACGDLFLGRADEAEFADANSLFRADRRAEDAARHGAMSVQVAGAGGGVERRAGFVVTVVFEGGKGWFVVAENAGRMVAREVWGEAGKRVGNALAEAGGAFGIGAFQFGESGAEAGGVELSDLEDTDAALGAADAAGEPVPAFLDGAGEFGVDDLDESLVAGWK